MLKCFETELAGRKLIVEIGKMCELSNGSCLVKYGDTSVLVNVTASKEPKEGIDFFPLSVDYEERLYSVGKIPGSFQKKEGRPSEKAILTSRAIDRPIRPLFPKDFRNDVCVNALVMSVEQDNAPEVCAMLGTSIAISISDIPFNGPTAAVQVGYVDDKIVINPTETQRAESKLNLLVAGTKNKVAMIEAGAKELKDEIMLEAIKEGHKEIAKLCDFIENIQKEIGKPKFEYKAFEIDDEIYEEISKEFKDKMKQSVQAVDKTVRDNNIDALTVEIEAKYAEVHGEETLAENKSKIADVIYKLEKKCVREMILHEKKRVDGRGIDEIRPLSCEVGLLPRTHGSAMFTRGQTQVMSIATLGMASEDQLLDGVDNQTSKRYMHHYYFPPYSVGEARAVRSQGRREIGHGALAERALEPVIPNEEEFPYTIRVVSEILSSNGSTSQASICGSTLALMDAGVPIKEPVAGISTGLVTDENDPNNYVMITDIQGLEDFFGDMDFKVGGTKNGITAIQVDIKIDGLTYNIIEEAFARTKKAREYILDEIMLKQIEKPREEISKYAPKIVNFKINVEKIKDVIGTGGKVINKIIAETGVKIDIEEDGRVFIYSENVENAAKAHEIINEIVRDIEVNQVYEGTISKIMNFGVFINLGGGKEGLLHISKMSRNIITNPNELFKVGDKVNVRVARIDHQGKIDFSRIGLETEEIVENN